MRIPFIVIPLIVLSVFSCDTVTEKYDRVKEGTEPDRAAPTVPAAPALPGEAPPGPRVVVVALPGLGSALVERGMMEGWLPNFRRLRTNGTLVGLETGSTPSALAAAATLLIGAGVERHGVCMDIRRTFAGAAPLAVAASYDVRMVPVADVFPRGAPEVYPAELPVIRSTLRERSYLLDLDDQNLRSIVLRFPIGFPGLAGGNLRVLGAGALPDLALGRGVYTFGIEDETAAERRETARGGVVLAVRPTTLGQIADTFLIPVAGPFGLGEDGDIRATTSIEVRASKDRSRATAITTDHRVEVEAGRWSEPLVIRFQVAPGLDLFGRSRLYLRPTGLKHLELYVEPPDFDPTRPPPWQSLSYPRDFAADLAARSGPLPRFTSSFPGAALADGTLDARDAAAALTTSFLAERRLFESVLVRQDYDLLYQSFSLLEETALIGPGGGEEVDFFGQRVPRLRLLEAAVAAIDELVGGALAVIDSGALGREVTVVLYSPYGAGQTTRSVDLNRFLVDRGDLVVGGSMDRPLRDRIDWSRTRAYSLGDGGIYVNLRGREPFGIVLPGEVDLYLTQLAAALSQVVDGVTGKRIVASTRRLDRDTPGAPDLVVELSPGFTVARDAALFESVGSLVRLTAGALSSDGDAVGPPRRAGLFGMTRLTKRQPAVTLEQVAATIPALLGVPRPAVMTATPIPIGVPMSAAAEEKLTRERKEEK